MIIEIDEMTIENIKLYFKSNTGIHEMLKRNFKVLITINIIKGKLVLVTFFRHQRLSFVFILIFFVQNNKIMNTIATICLSLLFQMGKLMLN